MGRLLLTMTRLLFFILTAAASLEGGPPPTRAVVRLGTASVTIIQAERIVAEPSQTDPVRQDRQIRKREEKRLVEFY